MAFLKCLLRFSLLFLQRLTKILFFLTDKYVKKKTWKIFGKMSEKRDPAATTATAGPGTGAELVARASGRAPALPPPVGVPPEGDEPTGHEDESQ